MPIFLQYILSFIGLIFAFGYGYGQFKEGRNKSKLDSISLLEADVKALREEVGKLTTEVHTLRNENENERKKFTEAVLAMQGRDPLMQEFIKTGNEYMLLTGPTIDTLKRFLEKQII